ncbi:MAG: sugar-binding transcriptional regulator [Clostridiales bacterium]|nr:sugar-binding transcriptional regulator [Clostridiales bacterium]
MKQLYNNLEHLDLIVPETKEFFLRRYQLMKLIEIFGPIGRRSLSSKSNLSERQVRNDADFLKDKGMIIYQPDGMLISDKGISMIEILEEFANHYYGFNHLKKIIIEELGIKDIVIVDSHVDDFKATLSYMGLEGAKLLNKNLKNGDIVGLTGGTSVYNVVNNFYLKSKKYEGITLVPARGGLGRSAKYQANTLVENLAKKLHVNYMPLYTPDFLSLEVIKHLKEDPDIRKTMDIIQNINLLVFGIGKADVMAKRRNLSNLQYNEIMAAGAVSEAFGYYFNGEGEIVHEISTIGISLDNFKALERLIAIAGGVDKAKAIVSISKINKNLVLVTDYDCAKEIIKILGR